MVRAKFRVANVVHSETDTTGIVVLYPVMGGCSENDYFYNLTPAGAIRLETVNANALRQFVMGREYYVDFTLADDDAQ